MGDAAFSTLFLIWKSNAQIIQNKAFTQGVAIERSGNDRSDHAVMGDLVEPVGQVYAPDRLLFYFNLYSEALQIA